MPADGAGCPAAADCAGKEWKEFCFCGNSGNRSGRAAVLLQRTGRIKGSYIRIGDSDEPMTEYEIYSYEAFRKKYQDDIREIPRATFSAMNLNSLEDM